MLDYKDITLISRQISEIKSRDDISISSSLFGESRRPIIASPMKDVCDGNVAEIMEKEGCQGIIHRFMDIEQQCVEATYSGIKNPICAIGINGDYLDRYKRLIKNHVKRFCIDVANSSSIYVKNTVKELLDINPDSRFIVGNAVSIEGVNYYNDIPEVEAIRVGVAGGKACTTKNATGIYYPMASLINECKDSGKIIIADGGIREVGDFCKAIALGADMVMVGSVIAKAQESPAELVWRDNNQYKLYHGSASYENQKIYKDTPRYIEGRSVLLEYKSETLSSILNSYFEGLRSSMSYCNATNLSEYRKNIEIRSLIDGKVIS